MQLIFVLFTFWYLVMNAVAAYSLITEKIQKLYFCECDGARELAGDCFTANGSYDFERITALYLSKEAEELQDYDYYQRCCVQLTPLFHATHTTFREQFPLPRLNVAWLGSNFMWYQQMADGTTMEQILLLTAMMEHALGNVFYTKTNGCTQPPHLLKDLLGSAELREVFGADAMALLKVIMGTPKSLNLRNIVWHGFPQPHEIPAHFVSVLLCICHSLGGILSERTHLQLQQRQQIANFDYHLSKLNANDDFAINCDYVHILCECKWLSGGHKLYWQQQLFKYYASAVHWRFVLFVLPQIELLLRLIYADANAYDVKAKLDEYYITMDTIFECDVPVAVPPSRKNKLLRVISEAQTQPAAICMGAMKCLYDLFAAPNGLRLRDKVSHGEVNINALNSAQLARTLLYVSLHLISLDETKFPLSNYKSRFHMNCICLQTLNDANNQFQHFCRKHKHLEIHIPTHNNTPKTIKIFQRPRKEAEIVELMRKIAMCHMQVIANYDEALEARLAQLSQRELHSKRRRTFEKQMAAMPTVCKTLADILECLLSVFVKLQMNAEEICQNDKSVELLVRFLKVTLHISENLVKYAHKEHNQWLKALELCKKFATQRERIVIWHEEVGIGS